MKKIFLSSFLFFILLGALVSSSKDIYLYLTGVKVKATVTDIQFLGTPPYGGNTTTFSFKDVDGEERSVSKFKRSTFQPLLLKGEQVTLVYDEFNFNNYITVSLFIFINFLISLIFITVISLFLFSSIKEYSSKIKK